MTDSIEYHREIPVKHDVDILVTGGGPAGCAAAWSAAKMGAKVLLIDGQGALGGMGTAGGVPAFMQFGDGVNFLAGKFAEKLVERMQKSDGINPKKIPEDNRCGIGIKAEVLKLVYDDMLLEAEVKLSFFTQLIDVRVNNRNVTDAICAAKSGVFAIRAKVYIDCTGDGDLCAWAGAEFEKGDDEGNMMPGTLCSLFCNIDFEKMRVNPVDVQEVLKKAIKEGILSVPDLHLPGIMDLGGGVGGGNISHAFGLDSTNEQSLTEHIIDSRRRLMEYENFYKKYRKGCDDMQLVATGALMGSRESRRIVCDMRLELSHFKDRASFEDEIGRYCYPIDIHMSKPDEKLYAKFEQEFFEDYRYEKGESYGIPYRCLIPRSLDNVLVAGRCIGSDRYIQGSIRVMPGCYITGRAAGLGAAKAIEHSTQPRNAPIKEITSQL